MQYSKHTTGKLAGIIFSISILMSCSNEKTVDDGYYFESFDNLKYWIHEARVTKEMAHSGSYAAFTDSQNEFSQTFEMDINNAKSKGYKSVSVSAWCCKTIDKSDAGLIVSVEGADKTYVRQSLDFESRAEKTNEWFLISTIVDLPEDASDDANLKIYLWSPLKEKAYLDDVTIEFNK